MDALEKHLNNIYEELVTEYAKKKDNERLLNQKDKKIDNLNQQIIKLRNKLKDVETVNAAFERDIENAVKSMDVKGYETAIKNLYRVYCKGEKKGEDNGGSGKSNTTTPSNKIGGGGGNSTFKHQTTVEGQSGMEHVQNNKKENLEANNLMEAQNVIKELVYQRQNNVRMIGVYKKELHSIEDKMRYMFSVNNIFYILLKYLFR